MKVLVDFDSTISDFDGSVIKSLNDKFGSTYVLGDVKTWDFLREMDPEHVQHTWGDEMYHSYRWTLAIPPLPGAAEGLRNLISHGYKPRIVTARNTAMKGWIEDWLRTNKFPKIPVTYTGMAGSKVSWALRYGYHIAIEDAPHHVLDFADAGIKVFMVKKLYNSHIQERPNIRPVDSLLEAAEVMTSGSRSFGDIGIANSGRETYGQNLGPVSQTDDPIIFQTASGYRSTGAEDPCY